MKETKADLKRLALSGMDLGGKSIPALAVGSEKEAENE